MKMFPSHKCYKYILTHGHRVEEAICSKWILTGVDGNCATHKLSHDYETILVVLSGHHSQRGHYLVNNWIITIRVAFSFLCLHTHFFMNKNLAWKMEISLWNILSPISHKKNSLQRNLKPMWLTYLKMNPRHYPDFANFIGKCRHIQVLESSLLVLQAEMYYDVDDFTSSIW